MPLMPKVSLSTVIHLFIVAVFLGLLFYSKSLYQENQELTKQYIEIKVVYEEKVKALTVCSTATGKLKEREKEITAAAAAAVAEAKKEANISYAYAQTLLRKRPGVPKITPENEKDFGGSDVMIQMKDYLSAQQLINDYIENEAAL